MSKYYRVRMQEQWDWLMKRFEEQDENIKWSYNDKPTGGISDLLVGILLKRADIVVKLDNFTLRVGNVRSREVIGKKLIEVSQMMEDEKMKEPMTEIVLNDLNEVSHGVRFDEHENKISFIDVPTRAIYPKVKFTPAEKAEFDMLDKSVSLKTTLSDISFELGYTNLDKRIYHHFDEDYVKQQELEFARAWADPSLIEVVEKPKYWVKCYPTDNCYFYKSKGRIQAGVPHTHYENFGFTIDEIMKYHLNGAKSSFEKFGVQE